MSYRTTFEAEEDLAEIFAAGIADHGIARAEAYLADLLELFKLIGREPMLMRLRDEYDPPVRLRFFKAHVVVYREEAAGALIIRVLYGRQDISNELN